MDSTRSRREELRARFRENKLEGFAPQEILELLLGYSIARGDVTGIAQRLIDRFGSVEHVLNASPSELEQMPSMSSYSATMLSLVAHMAEYYQMEKYQSKSQVNDVCSMGMLCTSLMLNATREMLYLIGLDPRGQLIDKRLIGTGTLDQVNMCMRDIMSAALQLNAHTVVITHNHPGACIRPSENDINTTYAVRDALATVGIELMDHIIVGGGRYNSMVASGLLYGNVPQEQLSPALREYTRYLDDDDPPGRDAPQKPVRRGGRAGGKSATAAGADTAGKAARKRK